MSDKLQELTERLYNEGLSKGKEEGARILEKANADASKILQDARDEAAAIVEAARQKAAELKSKAESDIIMASRQALQATKTDVENLLVSSVVGHKLNGTLADRDFLKEMIEEVCRKFSATEGVDIALVLPERMKESLEPWVAGELTKAIGTGITAKFTKKLSGGFNIGPSDGSYFISLSDTTFDELISAYLRPVTRKLLFGE